MEIKINIPPGPTAKIAIGIVAMVVINNYATEWVKKGLEKPLTPSTFITLVLCILISITALYWQENRRKHKS